LLTGEHAYLSDAELQLKAHYRQIDLAATRTWVPSLDNMGFAAGGMTLLCITLTPNQLQPANMR
jgi:hypothetical protein